MLIEGQRHRALIDTGCSVTLVGEKVAGGRHRDKSEVELEMMQRRILRTSGAVQLLSVVVDNFELGPVSAHVVSDLPLDVGLVVGLDVIKRVGISVRWMADNFELTFGQGAVAGAGILEQNAELRIDDEDFTFRFSDGLG